MRGGRNREDAFVWGGLTVAYLWMVLSEVAGPYWQQAEDLAHAAYEVAPFLGIVVRLLSWALALGIGAAIAYRGISGRALWHAYRLR